NMLKYCSDVTEDTCEATDIKSYAKTSARKVLTKTDIAPFMTSHWNQNSPYSDSCPKYASGTATKPGCIAIAAGQVLYYWRKQISPILLSSTPEYLNKNTSSQTSVVEKGTDLKLDLLKDCYDGTETEESRQAVADFVYTVAAANRMSFRKKNSLGKFERVPYTLSAFFGMKGGKIYARNDYSQSDWTELIYNELKAGRPVMYGGDDSNNLGHAVVIHGFRASDELFYFNFGWESSYDGYYTTSLSDGMNGYNNNQMALIGVQPYNMNVSLVAPDDIYTGTTPTFEVTVENNSSEDFKGIYLFVSTSDNTPSYLKNASSSDTKTVVKPGQSHTYSLTGEISSTGTWYIIVTDGNLNSLARLEVTAASLPYTLTFNGFSIDGTSNYEEHDGNRYSVIDGTSSMSMSINVGNSDTKQFNSYVFYTLYSSIDGGHTWDEGTTNTISGVKLSAGESKDFAFTIYRLKSDVLYKAVIMEKYLSTSFSYQLTCQNGVDSTVYFVLRDPMSIPAVSTISESHKKDIYTIYGTKISEIKSPGIYVIGGKAVLVQ
ncbi:MAG: C10 family peptidase, partial [Bacteroidaceae bacterium]|nr:C10 family peptidase [Bacteroidaceae bacterium]